MNIHTKRGFIRIFVFAMMMPMLPMMCATTHGAHKKDSDKKEEKKSEPKKVQKESEPHNH